MGLRGKATAVAQRALDRLGFRLERLQRSTAEAPLRLAEADRFAEFVTDDGRRIPLYGHYRDSIKATWRIDFWPTIAVLGVRDRIAIGPAGETLVQDLQRGRTLPVGLDEIADVVHALADRHPAELIRSEILSPLTSSPVVAARLTDQQVRSMATYYRHLASSMVARYRQWSDAPRPQGMKVLEAGCGMGYGVMALAALGVAESAGIESTVKDYRHVSERPQVSKALEAKSRGRPSRIENGDIAKMPFDNGYFDFIHSNAVVEHLRDPVACFTDMVRVLKPGGIMIHRFEPFFAPADRGIAAPFRTA